MLFHEENLLAGVGRVRSEHDDLLALALLHAVVFRAGVVRVRPVVGPDGLHAVVGVGWLRHGQQSSAMPVCLMMMQLQEREIDGEIERGRRSSEADLSDRGFRPWPALTQNVAERYQAGRAGMRVSTSGSSFYLLLAACNWIESFYF